VQQHYLKEHFAYIRDLLRKQLVYPTLARKMGWSGRAVVTFTVLEDGSVQKIRITESSGFSLLDKSALETVRTAAPFPRPPIRAEITVPVNFAMGP
jgi:protein TonB